jgi:AAA domain
MELDPDVVFRLGEVVPLPPLPLGRAFGRIRVLSVADAKAQRPRSYLVKGLVECGALSVVYGEPGCGKSFFAQHVGWRIAQGRPVFGRRVRPGCVLYLALEGESGFAQRVTGFAQEYGDTGAFHYVGQSVNFYSDAAAVADVTQAAKAIGARLVIVDTLARAIGEGDENTAGDMGQLITVVDALRAATGAHVMIVHHTGKDESRGMRGHSSLNGAADITLHVSGAEDGRRAEVKKNKDGVSGVGLGFTLRPIVTGRDEDGDEIVTMVVDEVEAAAGALLKSATKRERLAAEQRLVLGAIASFIADEDPQPLQPAPGMRRQRAVTRGDLLEHLRAKELLGVTAGVTDGGSARVRQQTASRNKMLRLLVALAAKKYLAFNQKYVWLTGA